MIKQIPEGFTPWGGGACPVSKDSKVQIKMRDGTLSERKAEMFRWSHTGGDGDIIAYRVIEAGKPKVKIPEGFTPWSGGACPVDPDAGVDVIMSDGSGAGSEARNFDWHHVEGRIGDIIAYRVVEEKTPQRANDIQVGGNHYKAAGVQPWEVVDTWPLDQRIGFYRGNALKYTMRMGAKDEQLTEIKKAAHYLQKLVEVLEEQKGGA